MSLPKNINISSHEPLPVAMYDVEDKKLVALFRSVNAAERHVFNRGNKSLYNGYITKKAKCHKNRFGRTICFRAANTEQVKQLGDEVCIILDERYAEKGARSLVSKFHTNSHYLKSEWADKMKRKSMEAERKHKEARTIS